MTSCTIQVQTRGGVGMIVLGDCAYRVYTKKKKKKTLKGVGYSVSLVGPFYFNPVVCYP